MKKLSLLLLVMLMTLVPLAQAQGDPAIGALEWLKNNQNEDGSYGEEITETAVVVITLSLLDEANAASLAAMEAYVSDAETMDLTESSIFLLAVVASGNDPEAFAEGKLLASFEAELSKARGQDVLGLCMGLQALNALGDDLPPTALMGLGLIQSEDGGFPDEMGGDVSDIGISALCAPTLVLAGNEAGLEALVAYFASLQLPDGGWNFDSEVETSDPVMTAFVLLALTAAGEDLMGDWTGAVGYLLEHQNEDGSFGDPEGSGLAGTTALAAMIFRGITWLDLGVTEAEASDEGSTDAGASSAPALDENWVVIAEGFGMPELNSADDFFVTVVDPFTNEELSGIQIINWTAEYTYTGYIIEDYLPAEVLLWMAEQDPDVWENISDATLALLPAEVLAELPKEVQARVGQ
jgi:hypothetical protein